MNGSGTLSIISETGQNKLIKGGTRAGPAIEFKGSNAQVFFLEEDKTSLTLRGQSTGTGANAIAMPAIQCTATATNPNSIVSGFHLQSRTLILQGGVEATANTVSPVSENLIAGISGGTLKSQITPLIATVDTIKGMTVPYSLLPLPKPPPRMSSFPAEP